MSHRYPRVPSPLRAALRPACDAVHPRGSPGRITFSARPLPQLQRVRAIVPRYSVTLSFGRQAMDRSMKVMIKTLKHGQFDLVYEQVPLARATCHTAPC